MATYDGNSSAPSKVKTGDIINYAYSGAIKSITLPKGTFKVELWGGTGGYGWSSSWMGGAGGYSQGTLTISSNTTYYIAVGGQGSNGSGSGTYSGGYNGGGRGAWYSGGGGGATHIAKVSGLLRNLGASNLSNILAIAGGGGGYSYNTGWGYGGSGGKGGGASGTSGSSSWSSSAAGTGGSQSSAGYNSWGSWGGFGYGGDSWNTGSWRWAAGGGGAGLYGGGGGARYGAGGGGGSGWTNSSLLSSASTSQGYTASNPGGYNGYLRITAIKATETLTIPTLTQSAFSYSGSTISPALLNYNSSTMTLSGTTSAINTGNYTLTVSLKDTSGYEWSDGTTGTKSLGWNITKLKLTVPSLSQLSYTFTGSVITAQYVNGDATHMTISGASATNVGTYTLSFTLKDTVNYVWSDGTTATKSFTWYINKAIVALPGISPNSFAYTGSLITPTYTDYNSNFVTPSGDVNAIDVGTYYVHFNLRDKTNCEWKTGGTAEIVTSWHITPAPVGDPYASTSSYIYTGSPITVSWGGCRTEQVTLVSGFTATDVGTYTAIFVLSSTTNYVWSDGATGQKTFTWSITKATLTAPSLTTDSYTYTGSIIRPAYINYNSDIMIPTGDFEATNAGSYTAIFNLGDTKNYQWVDGSIEAKNISWSITKLALSIPELSVLEYKYNGDVITPSYTNYNNNQIIISGEYEAVNSGSHIARFNLANTLNYQWVDGTTEEKTITWTIIKGTLNVPSLNVNYYTYNGSIIYSSWANYSSLLLSQQGTPYATAVGIYTVLFSIKDKINYQWVDGTDDDKSLTWEIIALEVPIPTLAQTQYTYTGAAISPTWANYNTKYITSSNATGTNAGTYTTIFKLKDPANSKWADLTTEDKVITWMITKCYVPIPYLDVTSYPYTSFTITPTWGNYNDLLINASDAVGVNAGNYVATFALKDEANSIWEDGTYTPKSISWKITKITISIPSIPTDTFAYSGTRITPSIDNYNPNYMILSGVQYATRWGSYAVVVDLIDASGLNITWADGTTTTKYLQWTITAPTGKHYVPYIYHNGSWELV